MFEKFIWQRTYHKIDKTYQTNTVNTPKLGKHEKAAYRKEVKYLALGCKDKRVVTK
jgi:hypothetical protein